MFLNEADGALVYVSNLGACSVALSSNHEGRGTRIMGHRAYWVVLKVRFSAVAGFGTVLIPGRLSKI